MALAARRFLKKKKTHFPIFFAIEQMERKEQMEQMEQME